jgi:hypothetical protein
MRSPHCPGSGATVNTRTYSFVLTPPPIVLCPRCRRWVGMTKQGTVRYHVAKLRTTAKLRDDARRTP